MQKYIGMKILRSAKLMTRAEYVAIMGWTLPEKENGADEVYMVEYEPTVDNTPNLEGYEGYVTMSPKLVFEEAYTGLMLGEVVGQHFAQAHEVRVQEEAKELRVKLWGLDMFIEQNSMFKSLPESEKSLMRQQSMSMTAYLSILNNRMESFDSVPFESRYVVPMNFGQAVEAAKKGLKIARKGWNGADMFVFLVEGSVYKADREPTKSLFGEGTEIRQRPHLDLKTADGSVATWSPSGSDALAEDWVIVD